MTTSLKERIQADPEERTPSAQLVIMMQMTLYEAYEAYGVSDLRWYDTTLFAYQNLAGHWDRGGRGEGCVPESSRFNHKLRMPDAKTTARGWPVSPLRKRRLLVAGKPRTQARPDEAAMEGASRPGREVLGARRDPAGGGADVIMQRPHDRALLCGCRDRWRARRVRHRALGFGRDGTYAGR